MCISAKDKDDNIIAITTTQYLVPGNDSPSCVDTKSIVDHTIGNTPPLFRIKGLEKNNQQTDCQLMIKTIERNFAQSCGWQR